MQKLENEKYVQGKLSVPSTVKRMRRSTTHCLNMLVVVWVIASLFCSFFGMARGASCIFVCDPTLHGMNVSLPCPHPFSLPGSPLYPFPHSQIDPLPSPQLHRVEGQSIPHQKTCFFRLFTFSFRLFTWLTTFRSYPPYHLMNHWSK